MILLALSLTLAFQPVLIAAEQGSAAIYINAMDDEPIFVEAGQLLEVPLFINPGPYQGESLKFCITRQFHEDSAQEYLNDDLQWQKAPAFLGPVAIPRFQNLVLPLPCPGVDFCSFILKVFMLRTSDGKEISSSATDVMPVCVPQSITTIDGLDNNVDELSIALSSTQGEPPPSRLLTIKNNCNQLVSCYIDEIPPFVNDSLRDLHFLGKLSVKIKDGLEDPHYDGVIKLVCSVGDQDVRGEISVSLDQIGTPADEPKKEDPYDPPATPVNPFKPRGNIIPKLLINGFDGLTYSYTKELAAGDSCEESITVRCTGGNMGSCSAGVQSSGDWLSVESSCGSGSVGITLDASGLSAGKHEGYINLSTNCGQGKIKVILTVSGEGGLSPSPGECQHSVGLSPSSVTKSTTAGSNANNETVSIRSCGENLSYTVVSIDYSGYSGNHWIESPTAGAEGNGNLTVRFDTTDLDVGSYRADIKIHCETLDGSWEDNVILPVNLTVNEQASNSNDPGGPESLSFSENGIASVRHRDFAAGEVKLFKFHSPVYKDDPIQIRTTEPSGYGSGYVEFVVKYVGSTFDADPPTVDDFEAIRSRGGCPTSSGGCSPRWNAETLSWYPAIHTPTQTFEYPERYTGDYYYCMNGNLVSSLYLFREDASNACWYLLVKNTSQTEKRKDVDITVCKPRKDYK